MDRALLERILRAMRNKLEEGADIGDLKVAAIFALGKQLEAIFYYVGHELAFKVDVKQIKEPTADKIAERLSEIAEHYHFGKFTAIEKSKEHITFVLENCNSCKNVPTEIPSDSTFCSFEAGFFAGIVEKMTNKHCFAQELKCRLQKDSKACEFMLVIPQEE